MMALTITTNNRPRRVHTWLELPPTEQADFDYVREDEHDEYRFVHAYGQWLDTQEFEFIPNGISVPVVAPSPRDKGTLDNWDSIQPGSAWHAIVLRWFDKDGYELEGPVAGWAQW